MQEHALLAWLVAELGDDMESCYERPGDGKRAPAREPTSGGPVRLQPRSGPRRQPERAGAGDWPRFQLALACVSERLEADAGRGRDLVAEARDWLGSYPDERVSADGVIRFFRELEPSMKVFLSYTSIR